MRGLLNVAAGATAAGAAGDAFATSHPMAGHTAATTTTAGFMAAAGKAKLNSATASATASTLMVRDVNGRAQVANPSANTDIANKSYVDSAVVGAALGDNGVSNAKLADVASGTLKGRVSANAGDPEDLTAAQVRSLLNVENGATADQTGAEIVAAINSELGATIWQGGGEGVKYVLTKATGDGIADDRAAINVSAGNASAAGKTLRFPKGTYKVGSNLTISVPVSFAPGASIFVSTGVTLTLNKEVIAGRWKIFQWSGTGVIRGHMNGQDVLPEWWGAQAAFVSDGGAASTYDNTIFIQAANDHLEARMTRGRLLFQAGMYGISGTLKVGGDGVTWQGAGKGKRHSGIPSLGQGATVIYPISNISASGGPALRIQNQSGARRPESITIRDLTISGDNRYVNASNVGARWFRHGVELNHVERITLENVNIDFCNQDGVYTSNDGSGEGPDQSYMHNVGISQCARYGINYGHGNEHLYYTGTVEFCGVTAGSPGILMGSINGVHLSEVSIESNYGPGVQVTNMGDFTMVGCAFEANSRTQAAIDPTTDDVVHVLLGTTGNGVNSVRIRDCYFTATDGQGGIHKHIYRISTASRLLRPRQSSTSTRPAQSGMTSSPINTASMSPTRRCRTSPTLWRRYGVCPGGRRRRLS